MALHVPCPNCGADVVFRSPALPSRICDHCQTMLVRTDEGIEMVGKAAVLPFDVSPIQMGTRGSIGAHRFEVIGRVRWGWTDGSWNEWLLLLDDMSTAWLGEAMGQFMLLRERPLKVADLDVRSAVTSGGEAVPGTSLEIDGERFTVSDARNVTCIAAEGELPFKAPAGWTVYSVDLRSRDGACANLQRDGDETDFYVGRYVELAELKPQNLRQIEGWARPDYAA